MLPLDHKKILNFFNFKSTDCDNLCKSSVIIKILASPKRFNPNLVIPLISFAGNYKQVSPSHSSKNSFNLCNTYGLVRSYNTLNIKVTTCHPNSCNQPLLFGTEVGLLSYVIRLLQSTSRFFSCYITKPIFGTRIAESEGPGWAFWFGITFLILNVFSKAESFFTPQPSGGSNGDQDLNGNSSEARTISLVTESESNEGNVNGNWF